MRFTVLTILFLAGACFAPEPRANMALLSWLSGMCAGAALLWEKFRRWMWPLGRKP
jgi:hypothetical protein